MRSVFAIFEEQNEKEVFDFFDSYCNQSFIHEQRKRWTILKDNDAIFYIYQISADELFIEMEDKSYFNRLNCINKPYVAWQIDISGRHEATMEIKELLILLLKKITGYAVDDYTDYFWTFDEIKNSALVKGHPFFDYNGWYKEYNKDKV